MTPREAENRRLLRTRDAMDRDFAEPLDVAALAQVAHVSSAHFIRRFKVVFGETPYRYLQRRRIERSMAMLRDTDQPITEVAMAVGFTSLGTYSRTFRDIVGQSPSGYRAGTGSPAVPGCVARAWMRPAG